MRMITRSQLRDQQPRRLGDTQAHRSIEKFFEKKKVFEILGCLRRKEFKIAEQTADAVQMFAMVFGHWFIFLTRKLKQDKDKIISAHLDHLFLWISKASLRYNNK